MTRLLAVVTLTLAAAATPAVADQIDGQWCDGKGKSLQIDGPNIVTPGGTAMTGKYDRHGFEYTVPANEPGAGGLVVMIQLSDNDVDVMVGPASGERPTPVRWHCCDVVS
ncbi:MAG: hypothetical protein VW644_00815 [Alphaproteobacteria bacterium]